MTGCNDNSVFTIFFGVPKNYLYGILASIVDVQDAIKLWTVASGVVQISEC